MQRLGGVAVPDGGAPRRRNEGAGRRSEKGDREGVARGGKRRYWGAHREARGCSSDGRALQSHCRGQGFDSPQLHQPHAQLIRGISEHGAHECSEWPSAGILLLGGSAYQSDFAGRCLARTTSPLIMWVFNLRRICSAPSTLMQTRRAPPVGRLSIAETPTFSAAQRAMTSLWASVTLRVRDMKCVPFR